MVKTELCEWKCKPYKQVTPVYRQTDGDSSNTTRYIILHFNPTNYLIRSTSDYSTQSTSPNFKPPLNTGINIFGHKHIDCTIFRNFGFNGKLKL